jgi:hypothetical protein
VRGLNVREVREALAGLDGDLPVVLVIDHALVGHVDTVVIDGDVEGEFEIREPGCTDYDVELTAPFIGCARGERDVEVRVAWEEAG